MHGHGLSLQSTLHTRKQTRIWISWTLVCKLAASALAFLHLLYFKFLSGA